MLCATPLHSVNGQAQVIKAMQELLNASTLSRDRQALSETVANVRWLIAAGVCDFQAMLDELGKLQRAPAPRRPSAQRA